MKKKMKKNLKYLQKKQGYKQCPKCNLWIEKVYGCNHMKCANPQCNVHFCYQCNSQINGEKWQDHFSPNNCVLWANGDDLLKPVAS